MALVSATAVAPSALATPRPLPFSYPPQTLPEASLEVEQYLDMVPVRAARETETGTEAVTAVRSELQTEFEYAITDRLEFAWYFAFKQDVNPSPYFQFEGVKQRLRFPLADRGAWPVDVGLYFEVGEFHDEIEFEEKVLLARRFGRLELVSNLWVEQEYEFQADKWVFVYHPTLGVSYDVSPNFTFGGEYWVQGRFDDPGASDQNEPGAPDIPTGSRHYLGPTGMVQRGEVFLSLGAYLRLDHLGEDAVVGDPWGKVWFRTLIGLHL